MDAGVGGQLQGISLDSFLQMVQMEKTTCTLKVVSGKKEGVLYILDGDLISAEAQGLENLEAACAIISWDNTTIEIENTCNKTEDEIKQPLMHVLMEGLKLKDEKASEESNDNLEATVPSDAPATEKADDDKPDEEKAEEPAGRDVTKEGDEFELHVAPKKQGGLPTVPIIIGVVIIAAAVVYFAFLSPGSESLDQVYQSTLAQVELTDDIDDQVHLLQEFINSAGEEGEWTDAAHQKINELKAMRESAAYLEIATPADDLVTSKEYMKAVSLYAKHLRRFPDSPNSEEIKTKISKLTALAEQTDYAAATAAAASGKMNRIDAYRTYIRHHPQGQQVAEFKKRISDMEDEYFAYTEKQIAKSAMLEDWANCTNLVNKYTDIYPDEPHTQKLNKYLPLFEKNRLEYLDYEKIMEKAHAVGTDYSKAQKVLADYLKSFPGTHLSKKIEDQISRYKKMDEETKLDERIAKLESLLAKSEGRFVPNGNGTFTDKRTGLIWCTLDSESVLDNCLNYQSANAYIKALNTGGHGDWRMPSPGELKTLLKVKPYFPETPGAWLWTSKILKKYVGEWLIDVTIITANNSPSTAEKVKDSRYCGNVRAIRRP
ncbi:MAG: DUF4388 domain-containing protein [Desulfobacterales bacterium]|nr:DUF4388 domain-containing protein [Desulfobacterales bacterium]